MWCVREKPRLITCIACAVAVALRLLDTQALDAKADRHSGSRDAKAARHPDD